jgi:hypothetical protein
MGGCRVETTQNRIRASVFLISARNLFPTFTLICSFVKPGISTMSTVAGTTLSVGCNLGFLTVIGTETNPYSIYNESKACGFPCRYA